MFWDVDTGTWAIWREGTENTALSSDGRLAATIVYGGGLQLWERGDAGEMQMLAQYTVPDGISSLALSPDDRWLATMRYDGVTWVWGVEPGGE
jgi:hypothetical protein